jgi:hypothetical protein
MYGNYCGRSIFADYFYRLTINLNNNAIRERFWTRDHRIDADKIRRSVSRRLICSVNVVFRPVKKLIFSFSIKPCSIAALLGLIDQIELIGFLRVFFLSREGVITLIFSVILLDFCSCLCNLFADLDFVISFDFLYFRFETCLLLLVQLL